MSSKENFYFLSWQFFFTFPYVKALFFMPDICKNMSYHYHLFFVIYYNIIVHAEMVPKVVRNFLSFLYSKKSSDIISLLQK